MTHRTFSRRRFLGLGLRLGGGLAAAALAGGGLGLAFPRSARATQVGDYKALVCIQLLGGNDGNNVIVPLDPLRYGQYQAIRGNLALSGSELAPPIADAAGNPYALHYGLAALNPVFDAGHLAVVLNTGMLEGPLTRAQVVAGQGLPTNLFSHSDQTVQSHTGTPVPTGTGWGGRLLDLFAVGDSLAAVSVASPALLLQGYEVSGNVIPPGGNLQLSGMGMWPASAGAARLAALHGLAGLPAADVIGETANATLAQGLELSQTLQSGASLPALATVFPGTSIGNQLKEAMRLIRLRSALGPGRQVFYCTLDGFDTHSSQDWQHWYLLSQLAAALAAFYRASDECGLASQVTTFTQSEFGRTLQPSGSGSDHGWGSHHLVLGGAVQGGICGRLPELALGGPEDANDRGTWIPSISTAQLGATLGAWMGATQTELHWAFPNLHLFAGSEFGTDLGLFG
jgi:uncharacterized protein (DUF1501 family)